MNEITKPAILQISRILSSVAENSTGLENKAVILEGFTKASPEFAQLVSRPKDPAL